MAGRLFSLRLLRSNLRPSTQPLSLSPLDSPLINLLASRFFSSRRAAAVSKEKSLIDDEAELSDWISDLKTDTVRFRVSDSDDEERPRRNSVSSRCSMQKSDRFASRGKGFTEERGFRGRGFRDSISDSDEDEPRMMRNSGSLRGSSQKRRSYSDSDDNDRFNSKDKGFNEERGFKARGFRDNKSFGGRRDNNEEKGFRGGGTRSSETQRRGRRDNRKESNLNFSDEERGFKGGARVSETQRGGRRENKKDSNFGFSNERIRGFTKTGQVGRETDLLGLSEKEDESDNGFSDSEEFLREDNKAESLNKTKNNVECLDLENDDEVVKIRSSNEGENSSYLSQKRFDECASLSEITLEGVKSAGYEIMTTVQEATLPVILQGKDVLAKARTGTGKTVAFLLPAIEMISKLPPINRDDTKPAFNVLIICPTRELAAQAAQEAVKLLKCHESTSVQLLIGGTALEKEQRRMRTKPSQILVATPGRLKDHIANTAGFANRLKGVNVLVLDEADRLLDMGFRPVIENIIGYVNKNRQTLLFSATVPDDVKQMCYIALKRDFEFINTVEEGSEETHAQVKQMHVVAPLEKQFAILHGLLNDHVSENIDYKVIVFCTTAMMTRLVAEYLAEMKLNIREIHSRKTQSYRTRVSKEFKESKGLILVSSDVSARGIDYPDVTLVIQEFKESKGLILISAVVSVRGVDYPDVTLVIQLGVPADREEYIHRLGRTGRKGKQGTGILLLAPWENYFLRTIQDLPITESPLPLIDSDTTKKVQRALAHVDNKDKEKAYQAWLGYYNSNKNIGKDKYNLVSLANEFSRSIGMDNPPALPKIILRKMGLNNIPGLRTK